MRERGIVVMVVAIAACLLLVSDFENQSYSWPEPIAEHPVVNLPLALQQENWIGYNGTGSCVVASMVDLLHWQGKYALADKVKASYSGGQHYYGWKRKCDALGIHFASTYMRNNVAFLEQCIRTRRGCMVTVNGGSHMVCLVDMTPTRVALLDNNYPGELFWVDRDEFLKEWRESDSWALTPVYSPAPPRIPL